MGLMALMVLSGHHRLIYSEFFIVTAPLLTSRIVHKKVPLYLQNPAAVAFTPSRYDIAIERSSFVCSSKTRTQLLLPGFSTFEGNTPSFITRRPTVCPRTSVPLLLLFFHYIPVPCWRRWCAKAGKVLPAAHEACNIPFGVVEPRPLQPLHFAQSY